jgi:hypothetical protein
MGDPTNEIVIGTGFGCATDIERGPDGFLYIVSLSDGAIYRITPAVMTETPETKISDGFPMQHIVIAVVAISAITVGIVIRRKRSNSSNQD